MSSADCHIEIPRADVSSTVISETGSSNGDAPTKEVHIDPKRYKTKICRNFMNTGACPYETRCMFAHGPHELRTPDENTRDGLVTESAIKRHQQQLMYLARAQSSPAPLVTISSAPAAAATEVPSCSCPSCVPLMYHNPYAYQQYQQPMYSRHHQGGPSYSCPCPDCNASSYSYSYGYDSNCDVYAP